jgi:subtilisin family serine protease
MVNDGDKSLLDGTNVTPESDARMERWQQARSARLAALPWLHTDTSGPRTVRYLKDELLVAPGHEQAARDVLASLGVAAEHITAAPAALSHLRLIAPGADIAAAARTLRDQAGPTAAGPHHVFVSSPFEVGGPYGPPATVANYRLPTGPAPDATVRVTVVDTGVWRDSPLPESWYEATEADYDETIAQESDTGHANFITGVIMANTAKARVRIVKVLDADGVCTETDLATALAGLTDVDIVNLSLGGFSHDDHPPVLLRAALAQLLAGHDRAVIAAAGNEGSDGHPYWPAGFAGTDLPFAGQVVSVAAHDGSQLCPWSNSGPWVDLAAPGSDIVSTYVIHTDFPTGFARWSGTSFSAPFVAAAVAESHAQTGTIAGAVAAVKRKSTAQTYGGYPGLA